MLEYVRKDGSVGKDALPTDNLGSDNLGSGLQTPCDRREAIPAGCSLASSYGPAQCSTSHIDTD